MSATDPTAGQRDPGNASDPGAFTEDLTGAELDELLGRIDNPDPIVTAGLAGTLYDPEYTGPGDAGRVDQEVTGNGE